MSIHSTLKSRKKTQCSVLKRFERLQKALKEDKWKKGDSIYGLPKFNSPKLKVAKTKEEKTTTLGKIDILEQHKLAKEKSEKGKKQRKQIKETTGRK